jgi:hypothetical protein
MLAAVEYGGGSPAEEMPILICIKCLVVTRSKFSCAFLKMKLLLGTVHRSVILGRGIGLKAGRFK